MLSSPEGWATRPVSVDGCTQWAFSEWGLLCKHWPCRVELHVGHRPCPRPLSLAAHGWSAPSWIPGLDRCCTVARADHGVFQPEGDLGPHT